MLVIIILLSVLTGLSNRTGSFPSDTFCSFIIQTTHDILMPGYVKYYDGLWAMSIFPFPLKRKADFPCFLKNLCDLAFLELEWEPWECGYAPWLTCRDLCP